MSSISTTNGHAQAHAQKPTDRLWEHQLRRENKALLQEIRESTKRCEAHHAEDERRRQEAEEKLELLEEKLRSLERQLQEADELSERRSREQQATMSSMKDALKARPHNDRNMMNRKPSEATTMVTESSLGPSVPLKTATSIARNGARPMPIIGPPAKFQPTIVSNAGIQNPFAVPTRKNPPRLEKQVTPRRPVTRSSMTRDSPEPADAVPVPPAPKFQRPVQGKMSMKNYYIQCGNQFKAFQNRTPQFEVDYIMAFIKGINESKMRTKLIAGLQQLHPSKPNANREVEILCEWEEVQEGLVRVGMWDNGNEKESKKRKRMLAPRGGQIEPRGMVETGF